ncbi:MAG: class I SAM-dependent methyltransferase [Lachnospiraceae bacterium]
MYKQVDLYMEPRHILNYMQEDFCEMSIKEHGFLCGLLKRYHPHKVVEVGVAGGATTAVIMKCLELIHSDAEVYSIDLNRQYYRNEEKQTGYQLEEIKDKLANYANHRFLLGHILPEVIDDIGNDIDFVILDTVHSLPGELLDFLCILPYLRDGAIVVMHDITLNFDGNRDAFATKIILNSAFGEKYYNYSDRVLNIAALKINGDTRKYAANLFSAFSITWTDFPSDLEVELYRKNYEKYYDEECIELFDIFSEFQLLPKEYFDFTEKEMLSGVYELPKVKNETEIFYQHFMNHMDEVCYILEPDGKLYGVVSRGDLYRYYENKDKKLKINTNLYSVPSQDEFDLAERFFQKVKTIHEVPVVVQGYFKGVIRNRRKNNKTEWDLYKEGLENIRKNTDYLKEI